MAAGCRTLIVEIDERVRRARSVPQYALRPRSTEIQAGLRHENGCPRSSMTR